MKKVVIYVASDKYPKGFLLGTDAIMYLDGRWNRNSRAAALEAKLADIRKWRNDDTVYATHYTLLGSLNYREYPIHTLF